MKVRDQHGKEASVIDGTINLVTFKASDGISKEEVEEFYTTLINYCPDLDIEFSLGAEGEWVDDD